MRLEGAVCRAGTGNGAVEGRYRQGQGMQGDRGIRDRWLGTVARQVGGQVGLQRCTGKTVACATRVCMCGRNGQCEEEVAAGRVACRCGNSADHGSRLCETEVVQRVGACQCSEAMQV